MFKIQVFHTSLLNTCFVREFGYELSLLSFSSSSPFCLPCVYIRYFLLLALLGLGAPFSLTLTALPFIYPGCQDLGGPFLCFLSGSREPFLSLSYSSSFYLPCVSEALSLASSPNIYLALLTAALTYSQLKELELKKEGKKNSGTFGTLASSLQMNVRYSVCVYQKPLTSFAICFSMPSSLKCCMPYGKLVEYQEWRVSCDHYTRKTNN